MAFGKKLFNSLFVLVFTVLHDCAFLRAGGQTDDGLDGESFSMFLALDGYRESAMSSREGKGLLMIF